VAERQLCPACKQGARLAHKTNLLIEILPHAERQALASYLETVKLKPHQILFDIRDIVTHVYFPTDCVSSLVVPLSTGEVVESAMVGRDGIIGTFAALDRRTSLNRAIVQIAGHALRCAVEPFNAFVHNYSAIRSLVAAHEQALFAQAQQAAACNATHVIESRLARWLLRAADLHGANELPLTQEYIAQMLGVRRTSVTVVARTLQEAGMIHYRRGLIKLVDIPALQETACECYQTVKLNYEALLHSAK
jgi:CRP-like cAMP-binding protein